MQLYHNHVVFQSFSDLYYLDQEEKRRQERRRQSLAAIQAASAMNSVKDQYRALRARRAHVEADVLYDQLLGAGVQVERLSAKQNLASSRVHWIDEEDEEGEDSQSSSASSSPTTSRTPSFRESRSRRRASSSSVETDATSLHSVDSQAPIGNAESEHAKDVHMPRYYVGASGEDLSYPAALYSSTAARRLQRKESDIATLEDEPGVTGDLARQDLSLRRFS